MALDVVYFLGARTKFIRDFYDAAISPFEERVRLIEAGAHPFEPPYSEEGEPAYLEEWMDANASIELIGRTCVSILSESLKLYLKEWERQLGLACQKAEPSSFKQRGFLHGYRRCFESLTGILWANGPFCLDTIEQVIHARNDTQHPSEIIDIGVQHRTSLANGRRSLFFARAEELNLFPDGSSEGFSFMNPMLHVSRDKLFLAISEIEALTSWLEPQLFDVKYPSA